MFCQSKTRKKQTGTGEKWGKIFFTYQVSTFPTVIYNQESPCFVMRLGSRALYSIVVIGQVLLEMSPKIRGNPNF